MRAMISGMIKRPVTAIVAIIALVVFAAVSLTGMNLKLMPDMSIPIIAVYTTYPGASPKEVDELVTGPICEACEAISGLKHAEARSYENLSIAALQMDYDTDMGDAMDEVKSKVDAIKNNLPDDIQDPIFMEIDTSAMPDITMSVVSENPDEDVLSIVEDKIEPELKKILSLAQVEISGGKEKYIRVQLIPEYSNQYGFSASDVADAIGAVNFSMPTGTASSGDQRFPMSAEVEFKEIKELEQVPLITSTGQTIHLADIANISYAGKAPESLSRYDGMDNVSLSLKRKQSESAVNLSRDVKKKIEEFKNLYPNLKFEIMEDSAETIIDRLKSVFTTVIQAVGLAMLVLFIFFGDLKGSLIVASTMPISLLATLCCMKLANFDLNVVTAGSLIIAVGMMTDNAVVVLEMCFRKRDEGLNFYDAALMGALVVSNSVITSTLTTVVVYLPMALLSGLSGQMFKPMGFTIIFALTASMIAALLLIPLCFNAYKPVERKDTIVNRILSKVIRIYEKILVKALKYKKTVFFIVIGIMVLTVFLTRFLRTELYSSTDEGIAQISVTFRPNMKLNAMDGTVRELEDFVKNSGYIKSYSTTVNESEASASISAHKADECKMKTQEIVDEWNLSLKDFSDICEIKCSAGSSSGDTGSSEDSKMIVITSPDLDLLKKDSAALSDEIKKIEGVITVTSTMVDSGSKAKVVIDPVMARARGFNPRQVAQQIYVNMKGTKAMDVDINSKTYDVNVEYPDGYFDTIADVEAMTFTNMEGVSVPLSEIGEVRFASAPTIMIRKDGMHQATLTALMTSDTKDKVSDEINKVTESFKLSPNVYYGEDTETAMMNEEFAAMGMAIGIAVFLVFVVMALQFNSIANSLLIMMEIPFAILGSLLYMIVTQSKISMVSLMGFLMLAGIVVNNGIILIDMAIQNQENDMNTFDALVDAGKGRFRPIIMTTLTTILAMIPTSMGFGGAADSMQGMAVVIVGGMVVSTVLTLVVLPTFFLLLESVRSRVKRAAEKYNDRAAQRALSQDELRKRKLNNRDSFDDED